MSPLDQLRGGLIVSCQAPQTSPLHDPLVIRALAQCAAHNGAVGVRLDTPAHIQAAKTVLTIPVVGLWKVVTPGSEVYITPTSQEVYALKEAGAEIIALDATARSRPKGESLGDLIQLVHQLGCLVLADISTLEEARQAVALGADAVATTLLGYTPYTAQSGPPGWDLLGDLITHCAVPVILEGGVSTPQEVQRALALGAWAVVVGTALTGLDQRIQQFVPH